MLGSLCANLQTLIVWRSECATCGVCRACFKSMSFNAFKDSTLPWMALDIVVPIRSLYTCACHGPNSVLHMRPAPSSARRMSTGRSPRHRALARASRRGRSGLSLSHLPTEKHPVSPRGRVAAFASWRRPLHLPLQYHRIGIPCSMGRRNAHFDNDFYGNVTLVECEKD